MKSSELITAYNELFRRFGHQSWWPGDSPIEIMVGAVLTQNTSWTNVEKAILNIKKAGKLSFAGLKRIPQKKLAALIYPAGYFNVKAKRLKNLISFIDQEFGGSIKKMSRMPDEKLRRRLLEVSGIGPETADSIMLYALNKKTFVIDAYTKRVFSRHGLLPLGNDYEAWQKLFMNSLPASLSLYNDFHAQIVQVAKTFCRSTAKCNDCPLESFFTSVSRRKAVAYKRNKHIT